MNAEYGAAEFLRGEAGARGPPGPPSPGPPSPGVVVPGYKLHG